MATDGKLALSRRAFVSMALCAPAARAGEAPARLVAAWDDVADGSHAVGVLSLASAVRVLHSLAVPTRAHGLVAAGDGNVIAVARRPGDWLLWWHPQQQRVRWLWNDGGRTFNGHARQRGARLFTTETESDSGRGVVVVRDTASLQVQAVWPTHGRDAHDLLFDSRGGLWVANGGIGSDVATGRAKDTRAMDSSLVCLDADSGALRGQWQLADPRLSLRHLARCADGRIGVALQAEHDDVAQRRAAPLLAVWCDGRLATIDGPAAEGYGGDIAALGDALFVSAPRAARVDAWQAPHGWHTAARGEQACALAAAGSQLWCGASSSWERCDARTPEPAGLHAAARTLRFDNHAVAY